MNRLNFPPDHPSLIRDGFLVHGFDMYSDEKYDKKMETFDRAVGALKKISEDAKVHLIPVYTNIRHLHSDVLFWMNWFFGAALSSVAHVFAPRLSNIVISSDGTVAEVKPWGSHPVVDPNYGSCDVQIAHGQLRSRLEKIKTIAEWAPALHNMRVCTKNVPGMLNCGQCEKCIRTMTMLLAIGKLKES